MEHKDDDREAVDAQLRQCNYDGALQPAALPTVPCVVPPLVLTCRRRAVTSCSTEEEALQSLSCCEQDFDLLMCEVGALRSLSVALPVALAHTSSASATT